MDFSSLDALLGNPKGQAIFLVLTIWSLIWKGIALWKAANNQQRNWFIILLVVNSLGILEIVYIFYFSKKRENKPKELPKGKA